MATWTKTAGPAMQNLGFGPTTATFSSVAVNNSSSSDVVVVCVWGESNAVISGVTIGGNSMTMAIASGGTTRQTGVFYITGATYTTPTVVVTGSSGLGSVGVSVGVLTGVTAAPATTAAETYGFANDPQVTSSALTIASGGFGIVAAGSENVSNTPTWNVGTQDYQIVGSGAQLISGYISASGSQTPSISGFAFAGFGMAAASWDPAAAGGIKIEMIPQTMGPMIGGFFG